MSTLNFFNEQHHLNEQGIALYVDAVKLHRLDDLPADILNHTEQCAECKASIIEIVDIMKNEVVDLKMKHPFFDAKPFSVVQFSRVYRIAAMFIFAAILGTLYFILARYNEIQAPVITQQPRQTESTSIPEERPLPKHKEDLFAENFVPSPNLDDLVQTEFRSTTVEVLSPHNGDIVQSPITFRWTPYEKPLKIKILTNKEITLLTSIAQKNTFVTAKMFEPGLYYWKLEDGDDLLYTGKFFVK